MTASAVPNTRTTIAEFLAHLSSLGINLSVDGEKLKLNAPKGAVTPELQAQIVTRKPELISALVELGALMQGQLPLVTKAETTSALQSLSQERLWSVQKLSSHGALFNMYLAFRLDGDVHEPELLASLHALVTRHPALRTCVIERDDAARADVRPADEWQPSLVDLADASDAVIRLDALRQAEIAQPFDLTSEMPFRATVVRLPQNSFGLILVAHHIAADGWSWGIMLRELGVLYRAALQGAPANLPTLPLAYADFAAWQRRMEEEGRCWPQLRAWDDVLRGARTLTLPATPEPAQAVYAGERVSVVVPHHTRQAIQSLARQTGTTPFAVLCAAFALILRHSCNQDDLVFCTPVACREQRELEGIVGYFNNLLPLRMQVHDQQSFTATIKAAQQASIAASSRQDTPFQYIAALASAQNINLARAVFSLQDASGGALALEGVSCTPIPSYAGVANFDLSMTVEDANGVFSVVAEYRPSALARETIDALLHDYVALLTETVSQPNANASSLTGAVSSITQTQVREKLFAPPANDTERKLLDIWEDVLGIRPISVTDSFFALGGHSLQAIRLMSRIESALNIALPQTALFEAPTIRALAQAIDGRATSAWRWLVPVQPTGDMPPLMLVHHGAGGVFGYARIGQHLHPRQRLYGIQEPGWRKGEARPESIEHMARLYLDEVRALQPRGPYHLGGFCFGAIVAYEMAQQLVAVGQEVALLALIDVFSPVRPVLPEDNKIDWHTSRMRAMSTAQRVQYLAERARHRAKWEATRTTEAVRHRARHAWYHAGKALQVDVPGKVTGLQFMEWNGKLQERYAPKPYVGRAILVRSQHPYPLRDYGWSQLIAEGVTVCDMPTEDHLGMLEEPHVQLLAQYLQTHLNAAHG